MLEKRIPRSAAVLAFGGGVIGDLAGFTAASYQRGIRLVQVPTTLLAQVDSSIGGKVGVNHPLGKNMIGAFHQPRFVWMDAEYLRTLPPREIVCGLGEVVKYGIIRDAAFFTDVEDRLQQMINREEGDLQRVVARCAALKADVVAQDEKEAGVRAILNFGHTVGHGLESAGNYKLLKHGEAVLLGMLAESFIAREMGMLGKPEYDRIAALIARVPMNVKVGSLKTPDIFRAMGRDKKRVGTKLRFVLPTTIGSVGIVDSVEESLVRASIKELKRIY